MTGRVGREEGGRRKGRRKEEGVEEERGRREEGRGGGSSRQFPTCQGIRSGPIDKLGEEDRVGHINWRFGKSVVLVKG